MPDKMESPDESIIKDRSGETPVPEWLEKLQNESWQAELLISGGALVGLFNAYDFIEKTGHYLKYSSNLDFSTISTFQGASGLVIFMLIIGFISHLVLRGFWIGLIGLNSVFPGGINSTKLSFKGRFRNFFKEEKNNSLIIRLDKVCGMIFALTFVALFSFLGVILFGQLITILQNVLPGKSEVGPLVFLLIASIFIAIILGGVLTLIDFLTGGRLKRIGWFAPIYYPIHWFMSIITLSFLYRRLYYTIVSNIKGFYLLLIFCIPIVSLVMLSIFKDKYSGLANSQNTNAQFETATQTEFLSIKNEIVKENEFEVSLLHLVRLEKAAFQKWKKQHEESKASSFGELGERTKSEILRDLYRVSIDAVEIKDADNWLISSQSDGSFVPMELIKLVKFIDVHGFENGIHKLRIKINLDTTVVDGVKINQNDSLLHEGYQATLNFILHRPKQPERIQEED